MKEIPTSYWPFELDHINDYAWIHDVFSKEECKKIISLCNKLPEETAKVGVGGTKKVNTKTRNTEIRWLQPGHDASIFSKLTSATLSLNKDFFKFDLYGFMEGIQFTRYHKGMFYKSHVDRSFNSPIRKLSISVLLSDPKTFKVTFSHKSRLVTDPATSTARNPQYHGVSTIENFNNKT